MPTNASLSFTQLVLDASLPVQLVMLFLLILSLVSWTIIFQRFSQFKKSRRLADEFEDKFWSGVDLNSLYQDCIKRQESLVGLEVIYAAGFKEFVRLVNSGPADQEVVMDGTYRQMKVASSREIEALETHLTTLATIGSISPYIGLFGTVWGIMHAFVALAAVNNATLAMVAPPIAEALIATAMGLFAAIPAVMCYNRFASRLEGFENRYLNFMDEFATILNRRLVTLRSMPQNMYRQSAESESEQTYAPKAQTEDSQVQMRSSASKLEQEVSQQLPMGSVVPPRPQGYDKTEARLPDNAAKREQSEYGMEDKSASLQRGKASPSIFSNVTQAGLKSRGAEVAPHDAQNVRSADTQSAGTLKPEFKSQEDNTADKSSDVPQYRVGVHVNKQSYQGPSYAAPQTEKKAEDVPHYRVGVDPAKRQARAASDAPVHYQVGPSSRQIEAMQRQRQAQSEPPAYRVGVTPEQQKRAAAGIKDVPSYQVGPKPLTQAEIERRERSLKEAPRYLTPGVNGDHLRGR